MKAKSIALITCVLCFLNTQAELKHFLPNSGGSISIFNTCRTEKYFFERDTIIQEKTYTKVYSRSCETETEEECICDRHCLYFGAVREDTIAEKIYFIQRDYTEEKLIADFDVKEGDKVTVQSAWAPGPPALVESVDSIEINGEYRKRITFSDQGYPWSNYPPDVWVEGIGSIIYGLFYPNPAALVDVYVPYFLCLHTDDGFVYQNPSYNTCYYVTNCDPCVLHPSPMNCGVGISDTEMGSPLYIYPTLVDKTLFVVKDEQAYLYRIYNTQGTNISSGLLVDNIDISKLSSGLYYIVFYDSNNKTYSQRFIKR